MARSSGSAYERLKRSPEAKKTEANVQLAQRLLEGRRERERRQS